MTPKLVDVVSVSVFSCQFDVASCANELAYACQICMLADALACLQLQRCCMHVDAHSCMFMFMFVLIVGHLCHVMLDYRGVSRHVSRHVL